MSANHCALNELVQSVTSTDRNQASRRLNGGYSKPTAFNWFDEELCWSVYAANRQAIGN
jgi:hypothetical protein